MLARFGARDLFVSSWVPSQGAAACFGLTGLYSSTGHMFRTLMMLHVLSRLSCCICGDVVHQVECTAVLRGSVLGGDFVFVCVDADVPELTNFETEAEQ